MKVAWRVICALVGIPAAGLFLLAVMAAYGPGKAGEMLERIKSVAQ